MRNIRLHLVEVTRCFVVSLDFLLIPDDSLSVDSVVSLFCNYDESVSLNMRESKSKRSSRFLEEMVLVFFPFCNMAAAGRLWPDVSAACRCINSINISLSGGKQ